MLTVKRRGLFNQKFINTLKGNLPLLIYEKTYPFYAIYPPHVHQSYRVSGDGQHARLQLG